MKRMRGVFACALMLTLLLPVSAYAGFTPVNSITFNDLESLIITRSQDYQNISASVVDAEKASALAKDAIDLALQNLDATETAFAGSVADDATKDAIGYLLENQRQSLLQRQETLSNAVPENTYLSIQMAQNTLIVNFENIYITCKALERQIDSTKGTRDVLEKQYQVVKLQRELGMTTTVELMNMESQLIELDSGLQQLIQSYNIVKQLLNVTLAQEYNTDLILEDLPEVSDFAIQIINVDEDYQLAKTQSYTMIINEDDSQKFDDAARRFENGFYSAYQAILDKQMALDAQKVKYAVAEKNIAIADLKYNLGMISGLQFASEKSAFAVSKNALLNAQDGLFQAFRQYQWAKRGLTVSFNNSTSGGTSSSSAM